MNLRIYIGFAFMLACIAAPAACKDSNLGDTCDKDDDCGSAKPTDGSAEVKLICVRVIKGDKAPSGIEYQPDAGQDAIARYCAIPCASKGDECGEGLMVNGRCRSADLDDRPFCTFD